jgi:ABC-type dipeptide/oligopeptide/nickel transport system permease subunit
MMQRSYLALLAAFWLLTVLLISLFMPLFSNLDPIQPVADPLQPPRQGQPLGTDSLGRDLWIRLVYGGRISPSSALLATAITVLLGGLIGLLATSFGGWIDRGLVWLANAALAIPGLLFAMLLVAAMGPSLITVILAVGLGGVPGFSRLARTLFQQVRESGYVTAAIALGGGRTWVAWHHILPNALDQLLSLATTQYAWAFMGTTTLTFLGLAGDPSIPDWGVMLNEGRAYLVDAPWLALMPGLAISFTILSVHKLGRWSGQLGNR